MWLGGSLFQQLGSPSRAEAPGCAPTTQSEPHLLGSGASLEQTPVSASQDGSHPHPRKVLF